MSEEAKINNKRKIEDYICSDSLPVNTLAFLERGKHILRKNHTNCADALEGEERMKFRRVLWFLNSQIHGQMAVINLFEEFGELCDE